MLVGNVNYSIAMYVGYGTNATIASNCLVSVLSRRMLQLDYILTPIRETPEYSISFNVLSPKLHAQIFNLQRQS